MASVPGGNVVQIEFGAKFDELSAALNQISVKFDSLMRDVNAQARGATSSMDMLVGAVRRYASAALLMYETRKSIQMMEQQVLAAEKLAARLGTGATQADVLTHALNDLDSSTSEYSRASMMLERNMRTNTDRMRDLGITMEDTNGKQKDQLSLMLDAISVVNSYAAGTSRNTIAQEVFGMRAGNLANLLKLSREEMERAEETQRRLGTGLTTEGVQSAMAYHRAMKSVGDVVEALRRTVATAFMPALRSMGEYMGESGPTIVRGFTVVVNALAIAFTMLAMSARNTLTVVVTIMQTFGTIVGTAFDTIKAKWNGEDWRATLKVGLDKMKEDFSAALKDMVTNTNDATKTIAGLLTGLTGAGNKPGTPTGGAGAGGGTQYAPPSQNLGMFELALAAERDSYERRQAAAGRFRQFSLAQEREYWEKVAAAADLSREDQLAIQNKLYALDKALRQENFNEKMALLQREIAGAREGTEERVRLVMEEARRIGAAFGTMAPQYQAALAKVDAAMRAHVAEMIALREEQLEEERAYHQQSIELERIRLETLANLGYITNEQRLAELLKLSEQEYEIARTALLDKLALYGEDEAAYAETLARIRELDRRHEVQRREGEMRVLEARKAEYDKWLAPIADGFEKLVVGFAMGTRKLKDIWTDIWNQMLLEYLKILVRMGVEWVAKEVFKTQATVAGVTTRAGAEAAGSAMSKATTIKDVVMSIGAAAWKAAANVYASIAGIPYIGPFLAPAMAVAAAATVIGFISKAATAAGGYDIPVGVNPMTQLHEREMVLPADIAEPLRTQLAGGGMGGPQVHFHSTVVDRDSVRRFLRGEGRNLADALGVRIRNFGRVPL